MIEPPSVDMNDSLGLPPRDDNGRPKRPAYRPPLGVPVDDSSRVGGNAASVIIHVLIILLILVGPFTSPELRKEIFGAGGAGPAGGGGGGSRGSGGGASRTERTQYVEVAPPAPPKVTTVPQIKPPEVKPVVPPPVVPPVNPTPKPVEPKVESKTADATPPATDVGPPKGTGGGTGNDGSAGTGSGTGGGVGSGVGTGRGSAVGAGTGGGAGTIYPPVAIVLFIPPIPAPSKLKGKEMIAEFDVDSTGKVIDFQVTSTKDGAYDKKLRESLATVRFRPAVNGLGVPVRAKTQLVYTF